MAIIRPFSALRPPPPRAKDVSSVPYDVVNTEEARALANGNPFSFLHVSRPEIDLPDGTDIHSDQVYRKAVENFQRLIETAPLENEATPSLYLYRLVMGDHEQIGLVGASSIDEYDRDMIRKHERTRRDKEDDRTRHMLMLRAQTGPVFLTYRRQPKIDELVGVETSRDPLFDLTAPDGVKHTIWRVADGEAFVDEFASVPLLYIADGHHRAASASRARAELKEQSFAHTGNGELQLFSDGSLSRFATSDTCLQPRRSRSERTLEAEFLEQIRRQFDVSENVSPEPRARGHWSMYLDGKWYGLQLSPQATLPTGTVASLDVSVLQDRLLDPILGIKDIRTDKRMDFVGGLRGTKELERLVNEGKAAVAFSLFPTTVEELLMVSDANEIMPPKSTWFEPKLRDGLLIHRDLNNASFNR